MNMEVGGVYKVDELPENEMTESGKLELLDDKTFVLATDGKMYEFKFAVECTAIIDVKEDGSVETIAGDALQGTN